nr:hypothetical protein [Actinomycetota bacterium]
MYQRKGEIPTGRAFRAPEHASRRFVVATVVDHQDFDAEICLIGHLSQAIERPRQPVLFVVGGDDKGQVDLMGR